MPVLQKLADDLGPRGLALVTIALDGSPVRAQRVVDRIGLRAPVLLGDTALRKDFLVESYPWTIVLGRDGKPRQALRGVHREEDFRSAFEAGL